MKIILLSVNKDLYSSKRIVEEAKNRGHQIEVINPLRCYVAFNEDGPMVYYKKRMIYSMLITYRV